VPPSTSRFEKSVCVVSVLAGPRSCVLGGGEESARIEVAWTRRVWKGEGMGWWGFLGHDEWFRNLGRWWRWRARHVGVGVRMEAAIS